jgi:hypothetical protein
VSGPALGPANRQIPLGGHAHTQTPTPDHRLKLPNTSLSCSGLLLLLTQYYYKVLIVMIMFMMVFMVFRVFRVFMMKLVLFMMSFMMMFMTLFMTLFMFMCLCRF